MVFLPCQLPEMQTKQTIAIIGNIKGWTPEVYGNIASGNYRILFPGNDNQASDALINDVKSKYPLADMESIDCMINACWEADIIITTVPFENSAESNEKLQRVACQKTVIVVVSDSCTPGNQHNEILMAAGVQQLLPYSKIIVALYNADKENNGLITLQNGVASRHKEALESAADILELAGFSIKKVNKNSSGKQSILN
jgi:predicted dinucleotide-binding enzyme